MLNTPIPHLVKSISYPVIIGMFFQTMYNVVDTWAAGKLSTEALAALTASFPIFFLIIAASHGCQSATNALLSHALGAEAHDQEEEISQQSIVFATWMSLVIGWIGWLASPWLLSKMNVTGAPFDYALEYVRTLFWATPFFVFSSTLHAMLSAHGETRPFRNSLIIGFLLNIVFDLWFVFGGYGLPAMGFSGIARATFIIQALNALYMGITAFRKGALTLSHPRHLIPNLRAQRRLMGQGFPAFFNLLTIAIGIFVYTYFAASISDDILAAFGTAMRIEQIALLPAIGLNTAAMTLAGHSYGARRLDRIRETFHTCLRFGAIIFLIGVPLVAIFAPYLVGFFTDSPEVRASGTVILRISMLSFYAYVLIFVTTSMLQGLQRPMFAIWIGFYRQIFAPLLIIPLLMSVLTPTELGIWWGAFFSVWSGAALTLLYAAWVWKKLKSEIIEKK
jgi:putative MATE family efflux protein